MKWLLVVMVFGTSPVKTDMVFDTLEQCIEADDAMRTAYANEYNAWLARAKADPKKYNYPASQKYFQRKLGIENTSTCVPHS